MELPVGALVRFRNMLDPLYNIQSGDQVVIQLADIADDADDGGVISLGDMGAQVLGLDPLDEIPYPLFFRVLLYNDNHSCTPSLLHRANKKACGEVSFTAGFKLPYSPLTRNWGANCLQQKTLLPF